MRKLMLAVLILGGWVMLASLAGAGLTNQSYNLNAASGQTIMLPLELAGDPTAGINGQLNFDTQYFQNPRLLSGIGGYGFNLLGNEWQPGQYRFVVYADPTANLLLNVPTLYFQLDVKPNLTTSAYTDLTFTIVAAGNDQGVSLTGVDFQKSTVRVVPTAVSNWIFYE